MTARRMYRYVVSVDDQPHMIPLSHNPVAVAAIGAWSVEFWAEHTEGAIQVHRWFQVVGTGHPLPEDAKWTGTPVRGDPMTAMHVTRDIPGDDRHNHLGRDVRAGEIFYVCDRPTYGAIDTHYGIALSEHEGGYPFFEFPRDAVTKASPASENARGMGNAG